MTPDELPPGVSYYDGQDTLYFRGDGIYTSVSLPAGKVVVSIRPPYSYSLRRDYPDVLFFIYEHIEGNRAVPNGELVTITLKDATLSV
jgi:hypothetical protein